MYTDLGLFHCFGGDEESWEGIHGSLDRVALDAWD